ncbi:hypothetical protein ABT034_16410 [Streptomyces sp. NPDC002773]|uniref:hypothetical protein n=1 Tax=Streptomyces sp. NPDC002773 TaxID=3154430 RepID=UPI003320918D
MTHTPHPSRTRPRARSRRALLCAALLALTVQTAAVAPALAEPRRTVDAVALSRDRFADGSAPS